MTDFICLKDLTSEKNDYAYRNILYETSFLGNLGLRAVAIVFCQQVTLLSCRRFFQLLLLK